MIWILATVGSVGIIGMAVEHGGNRDALFTMIGHIAIFATALLTLIQSRANGMKMDAAKKALEKEEAV